MTIRKKFSQITFFCWLLSISMLLMCFDAAAQTGRVKSAQIPGWMPDGDYFKVGSEPFISGKTAERIRAALQSGRPAYVIVGVDKDSNGNILEIHTRLINAARQVASSPLTIHCDLGTIEEHKNPRFSKTTGQKTHCHRDWQQHEHAGSPGSKLPNWHRHVGDNCGVSSVRNNPGPISPSGTGSAKQKTHCHRDWQQHEHAGSPGSKLPNWHRHVGDNCGVSSVRNPW